MKPNVPDCLRSIGRNFYCQTRRVRDFYRHSVPVGADAMEI